MAKSLEAGKLIVGAVAVCAAPTGTAAATLGIDAILQIKQWFSGQPDLEALSREIGKRFDNDLKSKQYDIPDGVRVLLPQMLEAAYPSKDDLVDCGLDAEDILSRLVEKLEALTTEQPEYAKPEHLTAFRNLLDPILNEACDDPRLNAALAPHFRRKDSQFQTQTTANLDRIEEMMAAFAQGKAEDLKDALSLDEMRQLADKFGIENVENRMSFWDQLSAKARDYQALKSEVDAINPAMKRLSNLKAAAQDAIARVNLEGVEEILSLVHEAELEETAKTAELRANNALLRGNAEQAYKLLSFAADSFAVIDPGEPTRRRLGYEDLLCQHGLRFGGSGLHYAAEMNRVALSHTDRNAQPKTWAHLQNNLGIALKEQGIRTDSEAGAGLLVKAVTAYRAALEVYSRVEDPVEWAGMQNNIGLALVEQGTRTNEAAGAALLAEAVTAYRTALEFYTRADHAVLWAMTQNNLGIALRNQSIRTDGAADTALLAEAVSSYRAALEIYTRAEHPLDWAMTQNNLGIALRNQSIRTDGAAGAALLAEAVTVFRAALEVYTRTEHPLRWATTQKNIAVAELAIARRLETENPEVHLASALAAVEGALEVYDPEHMSYDHRTATELKALILAEMEKLA